MKKKIYMVVLLFSLIATGVLLFNRMDTERAAKSVEILADYEEFSLMAEQQDIDIIDMFKMLKDSGVTSVALKEETLASMVNEQKPLEYDLLKNVQKDLDWEGKYGKSAVEYMNSEVTGPYDVVVRTYDQDLFNFIMENASARYDEAFYRFFDETVNTIVFKGSIEEIYYAEEPLYRDVYSKGVKVPRREISSVIEDIGLGFDPVKIQQIKAAELPINLRPNNFNKYNDNLVNAYFNDLEKYNEMPTVVIFNGSEILSFNKARGIYAQSLYDELKSRNIPIAMVEASDQLGFIDQAGLENLAQVLEYNVVRVLPVIEYIQQRYNYLGYYEGAKEIENTLYRAITERNIRMIYFRPFKDSKLTFHTDLDEYAKTFENLSERLEPHGLTIGNASVMPYNHISVYLLILSALGLLVLGLIILKLVFDIAQKFEWFLFGSGILAIVGISFIAPNRSVDLFALAAANIYAIVAIIFLVEFIKDLLVGNKVYTFKGIVVKSAIGLAVTVLIAMVGGLYVSAIMSRTDYLLEISYFRGVKLSLMFPMVAFVLIYLIKLGFGRSPREIAEANFYLEDLKRFVNLNVKMYYLFVAAALGVIIYVYLARSGHSTNIEVLNIELIFRNMLENIFMARPRTKEIFIAFPALVAAVYFAARGYKWPLFPFMLAAVTGITSVINTFCHSRAPVYLSASRTLISFGFSIVIGLVVLLIIDLGNRIYVATLGSKKYE